MHRTSGNQCRSTALYHAESGAYHTTIYHPTRDVTLSISCDYIAIDLKHFEFPFVLPRILFESRYRLQNGYDDSIFEDTDQVPHELCCMGWGPHG